MKPRYYALLCLSLCILSGALSAYFLGIGSGLCLGLLVACMGSVLYLGWRVAQSASEPEYSGFTGQEDTDFARDYAAVKQRLRELELDYKMGKLTEEAYQTLRMSYREKAAWILQSVDAQAQDESEGVEP